MASSRQQQDLHLLQQVFVEHLLPRLSLAALHCFSQACSATRAAAHGLPDSVLLAAAQACWLVVEVSGWVRTSFRLDTLQAERLPISVTAPTGIRGQLDALAAQGAAVRAGDLAAAARLSWDNCPCYAPSTLPATSAVPPAGGLWMLSARPHAVCCTLQPIHAMYACRQLQCT